MLTNQNMRIQHTTRRKLVELAEAAQPTIYPNSQPPPPSAIHPSMKPAAGSASGPPPQMHILDFLFMAVVIMQDTSHQNYLSHDTKVIHSEFTGSGNYDAVAVYGKSRPADYYGYGGYFEGGNFGVLGEVNPTGSQVYCGVMGGVSGGSGINIGLYGWAQGSGANRAVYAYATGGHTNWAGYFDGNAKVTGTLTKGGGSFQIDHPLDPENKYLFHSFVESPDMKNVYDGNVILDAAGQATVELPAYFEALNRDFRYQLTGIGAPGPNLYISQEISGNSFKIAGGEPGMKVSWQVTGIRHDRFAEANRIQVEVDKPDNERGKYLHPEAYNLGEEYDIHYEQRKQMKEQMEKEKMD